MSKTPVPSPYSAAVPAIAGVFTASLLMFLPGVLGGWIDGVVHTTWMATVGFVLGPPLGLVYLLYRFRPQPKPDTPARQPSAARDDARRQSPPR